MASSQHERKVAVELSYEEKVSLDGLIKHAWSQDIQEQSLAVVAKNESINKAAAAKLHITVLAGALLNKTKGSLNVLGSKKWSGHIVNEFSNPLSRVGAFALAAPPNKGVKAAVVYHGKNHAGVECGWLLAWADTKALGKRVYAECGHKSKFNHINWAQIEHKLDHAGEVAKPHDKETGTGIYATIVDTSNKDVVAAAFTG